MAVYDQSYAAWSGTYESRFRRVLAMIGPGLVQPFRTLAIRLVVILAFILVGGWLLLLFMAASSQMPQIFALGNNIYREALNNTLFTMTLLVLSIAVGAGLISRDLKHHAVLMYFSRAISRRDYVTGKFVTLALFLLFATLGPGLVLFAGQMAMGTEEITLAQRLADLGSITLHSLILVVPMSAVVLACSSMTKHAYLAGILWATIFFSSTGMSAILTRLLEEDWCALVSWTNLTTHLSTLCYQARPVKAGLLTPPQAQATLSVGWIEPLLILVSVTVVSLLIVRWRVRGVEAGE